MTVKHLLIQELEKAFGVLNGHLFGGKLTTPEFVLQPKKKVVVRWLPESSQMTVGGDLVKMDLQALLVHLLHEMVHVSNHSRGIVDCRSNQYHNKIFLTAALEVGLTVVYNRTHGWGITTITSTKYADAVQPNDDVVQRRAAAFEAVNFDKMVLRQAKSEISKCSRRSRQTTYFLKYECGCLPPHNSIRSGRRPDGDHPLNICCRDCGKTFVCVDAEDE